MVRGAFGVGALARPASHPVVLSPFFVCPCPNKVYFLGISTIYGKLLGLNAGPVAAFRNANRKSAEEFARMSNTGSISVGNISAAACPAFTFLQSVWRSFTMLPTALVMKLLTDEAETLEGDARRVEAMLPKLPDSEGGEWKETAKEYRERASDYKSIIEAIKASRAKL